MSAGKDSEKENVIEFPRPRTRASELGVSSLCLAIGADPDQMSGHWCSFCRGIWYGFKLEVACPACGNRHG